MARIPNELSLLACVLITVGTAWGQGAVGTLNGTILDAAGAVVPGATIIVTNNATGVETNTASTSAGAYTIPYLPAGTYTIRVSAAGFRTAEQQNVILRVAQTLTVNISLELGQVTEQVTVTSEAPLLESGTAEIGRYISEQDYKAWPVFVEDGQRQIQSFIFSALPGTTGGTFKGSINGGQEYSHEILIEGMPVGRSDLSGGNNNEFSPSAEAIGEFKLQEGAIGAQYNGGQTAVANFNIKSGTNDLHGSAFYYGQNEALNAVPLANKTFGQPKARNRDHNYGYSVGGPVYIPKIYNGRNRTFFFTNFERDKRNDFLLQDFATLATPAFKNGDFSRLFNPSYTGQAQSGTVIGNDALGRPIVFGQIYDPHTTRTVNGQDVRDPFPGNIIPESAWDPVAKNIVKNIGIGDPTLDTMVRNIQNIGTCCPFFKLHIIGIKGDHNITDKHRISGYYNHSNRDRNNSCNTRYLPIPGLPTSCWQEQITPGRMVRLSLNSTLSPTVLNRLAGGYNRFRNQNGAPPETIDKDLAGQIGFRNLPGTIFPVINFGTDNFAGEGAEYQGNTIGRMGVGYADNAPNGSWVGQDDLTWIHGKHTFRFGYEYKNYFYNDKALSDAGRFNFSPRTTDLPGYFTSTGHAFASFLLGAVYNGSHNIQELTQGFRQPQHAFYAADDWKVTPRLTLNFGLRWEIIPPFYEVTGRMSEISLTAPNPEAGGRPGALVFDNGNKFSDTYWREFGPRFGVAYQVSHKMVVRAGYAMMNTPPIRNDWGYGGFTFGFNGTVNVPAGTSPTGFVDDPSIYLSQPFPGLESPLPNSDPSSANYVDTLLTTARDANRPGYTQNWNFTIQYELPHATVLELAYVGNKGTRLWGATNKFSEMNGLPAALLARGDILNDPISAHPELKPFPSFPDDLTVSQAMRPYPQYFGVEEAFPYNTNSNYNSLQVTVTRHLTKGLGFLASYTWSKAIGYVDSNGPGAYYATVQDYFNRSLERSVTEFNYPQNFKMTWVYETPFGKGRKWDLGWANYIVGGWQIAATHNYRSGDPILIYQSGINTPSGFSPDLRGDILPGQSLTLGGAPGTVDYQEGTPYLNPAAFAPAPRTPDGVPLRVGTVPRYLPNIRGPHSMDESVRASKKFPIVIHDKERLSFGVGVTMINALNRTTRYIQDKTIGDSNFGQVYRGGGPRTLQLDGRIEW